MRGIRAREFASSAATVDVTNSTIAGNGGAGLELTLSATMRIGGNRITGNDKGFNIPSVSGVILSAGNNIIDGNANPDTGSLTPLALQ